MWFKKCNLVKYLLLCLLVFFSFVCLFVFVLFHRPYLKKYFVGGLGAILIYVKSVLYCLDIKKKCNVHFTCSIRYTDLK